jgi:hypothetical protein
MSLPLVRLPWLDLIRAFVVVGQPASTQGSLAGIATSLVIFKRARAMHAADVTEAPEIIGRSPVPETHLAG